MPSSVSRAQGDIHPDGNPHFYLDMDNIPPLAEAITEKLAELDLEGAGYFRKNNAEFIAAWNVKTSEWKQDLDKLRGKTVIEYHKNMDYLLGRFEIQLLGTVELLPGIPPTSKHIEELEQKIQATNVYLILQDVYNTDEASRHLSKKHNIPMVKLPHDVGAVPQADGIFSLFDEITRRLTHD